MSTPKSALDWIHYAHHALEGADIFYGHGTDNPWDEACALILDALDLAHDVSDQVLNQPLSTDSQQLLAVLLDKRIQHHIPTPYLTHKAWFCGMPFYIDERALIPRSPLAEWIDTGGEPWLEPDRVMRVLDLCTGSGCIAIACAYAYPNAVVDAVDLSADALAVACQNVDMHDMQDRVHLYEGDLFSPVVGQQYDLIISNPPYVPYEEMQELPAEYLQEPDMALRAGEDGLFIVDQILKTAKTYLKPAGVLVVEVGNTWQIMDERYPSLPFTWLEFEQGGDGVFLLTRANLYTQ